MPYVAGESLRQRLIREATASLRDALRIAREVGSALDYAHRQGFIHRDIKPENILLSDGQAMVADFGIARAVSAAGVDPVTETGLALGTPAYMSPEQASGERELDVRSDLYSLACVLYEMLAGEPPFTGPHARAIDRPPADGAPPVSPGAAPRYARRGGASDRPGPRQGSPGPLFHRRRSFSRRSRPMIAPGARRGPARHHPLDSRCSRS